MQTTGEERKLINGRKTLFITGTTGSGSDRFSFIINEPYVHIS